MDHKRCNLPLVHCCICHVHKLHFNVHAHLHFPRIKRFKPQKAAVLWQLRQVILSGEECHCNPLMLLSHPQRVWVSVPALIYIDRGWRKWSFSLRLYMKHESGRERERERAVCSSRHRINAFTMLLQCQPGDDISVISHSVCNVLPLLLSVSLTLTFPLLFLALTLRPHLSL